MEVVGMEPLGTITMCFPYVDEKTRSTLELMMNEAENYTDFTEKLIDRVVTESSSPVMEYLAISFAYRIENYNLIDRLEAAGKVSDLARPLLLHVKVDRGENISWSEVKASLVNALNVAPNDWISSHLYLTWRMSAQYFFSEADAEVWPLDTISAAVNENSELGCFESYLFWITAKKLERENKRKEAISLLKQTLAIARKFDDGVFVARTLVFLAGLTKLTDLRLAIDMLITAKELFEKLGYDAQIGYIQHQMGHIMGLRGEFDAAVEYQSEFKGHLDSLGSSTHIANSFIALYHNLSGNGEMALDLYKKSIPPEEASNRFLAYARAQQAWALINLGRYAEAKSVIATCQRHALKSGDIGQIVWYHIVEGLLDKAERRFENAQMNFQKVLDFDDENPTKLFQNICLLNLTEMEIDMLTDTVLHENHDFSGQWMKKLEEYVQENDLPGITAQSMIFKAKLRYRQGKYDEVRKILKEVQDIARTSSMKYLNEIIISKFPDVIVK
jgi:tetratricopeptide (TPR) repeat protein